MQDLAYQAIKDAGYAFAQVVRDNISKSQGRPSRAGQYPAKQTGHLAASISIKGDKSSLQCGVGTSKEYGMVLEKGSNRIKARPWLVRSVKRAVPAIKRAITSVFRSAGHRGNTRGVN